jgi:hypothetical protein
MALYCPVHSIAESGGPLLTSRPGSFLPSVEDAGRTLHHVNIVRALTVARPPSSTVTIAVPTSLSRSNGEIIVFVQHEDRGGRGMPIRGAARAPLPA